MCRVHRESAGFMTAQGAAGAQICSRAGGAGRRGARPFGRGVPARPVSGEKRPISRRISVAHGKSVIRNLLEPMGRSMTPPEAGMRKGRSGGPSP